MDLQKPFDATADLESLLARLDLDFYTPIEAACGNAVLHIRALDREGGDSVVANFVGTSQKLTQQVMQYIRMSRVALLPYFQELLEKEESGHDCRSCSSSCTIRHTAQIWGIKEAHTKIRETLIRIPLAEELQHAELTELTALKALKVEINRLEKMLATLFQVEESSLIPKVLEAQKNIHAHS